MARSCRVDFSGVADRDLESVLELIATDDPLAASRVLDQIESRVASLKRMTERGRIVPELAAVGIQAYRELVVTSWWVVYRISRHHVYVLAVLDGHSNVEDVLLDRLIR